MIDGIVFDKDGTLFDFRKSWGSWALKLLSGLASDDVHLRQMAEAIGFDPVTCDFAPHSPVIAATAPEIAAELLPFLPQYSLQQLTLRLNALAETAVMQEAVPLDAALRALKVRGLKLGLATNDYEAPARAHLAAHGVAAHFDFIAGCDSGHGAKPAPGMLLAFARQLRLSPDRVVMVGDSRHDLAAGRAAGMRTVAVLTGIAHADELSPYADAVLPDIGYLGGWIDALLAG